MNKKEQFFSTPKEKTPESSPPEGVEIKSERIEIEIAKEKEKLTERFQKYTETPFLAYDDFMEDKFGEPKPKYYKFLKECESLAQVAFLHEADTIVFFDKSARGYGLLVHKILPIVALDKAIREGISPRDIKLPGVEFFNNPHYYFSPPQGAERIKEKELNKELELFGGRIRMGERIVFFDEGTGLGEGHLINPKWSKEELSHREASQESTLGRFDRRLRQSLTEDERKRIYSTIGISGRRGGYDGESRRVYVGKDYNIEDIKSVADILHPEYDRENKKLKKLIESKVDITLVGDISGSENELFIGRGDEKIRLILPKEVLEDKNFNDVVVGGLTLIRGRISLSPNNALIFEASDIKSLKENIDPLFRSVREGENDDQYDHRTEKLTRHLRDEHSRMVWELFKEIILKKELSSEEKEEKSKKLETLGIPVELEKIKQKISEVILSAGEKYSKEYSFPVVTKKRLEDLLKRTYDYSTIGAGIWHISRIIKDFTIHDKDELARWDEILTDLYGIGKILKDHELISDPILLKNIEESE